MNKLIRIQQGESLPFKFDRGGDDISGWTCTIHVKQYPDDTDIFTRAITARTSDNSWPGFITSAETTNLNVGLHYLVANIFNVTTDEIEQVPVRFSVTRNWV